MRKWLIANVEVMNGSPRYIIIGEFKDCEDPNDKKSYYLERALTALVKERLVKTGYEKTFGNIYTIKLGKIFIENVFRVTVFGWLTKSGTINSDGNFVTSSTRPLHIEKCGEVFYKD